MTVERGDGPVRCVLTHFYVKNFKSIGERGLFLELKPLTVFFGPQGSGKSAILEALWRFCKLISSGELIGNITNIKMYPTESTPKYVSLSYRDLIHKRDESKRLELGIFTRINQDIFGWRVSYSIDPEGGEMGEQLITRLHLREDGALREEVIFGLRLELVKRSDGGYLPKYILITDEGEKEIEAGKITVGGEIRRLDGGVFRVVPLPAFANEVDSRILSWSERAQKIAREFQRKLKGRYVERFAILSPLRGYVPLVASTDTRLRYDDELTPLDPQASNLIQFLSTIAYHPGYSRNWESILNWSAKLGLVDLRAGYTGTPNELSSECRDSKVDVVINLAHASHGGRQALSMCAQLFAPSQDLIMIEEPEISLHPESVAMLPEMFYEAMRLGKQIIITTHSSILPLAIPRLVRRILEDMRKELGEGAKLDPNEIIAVYELSKDEGGTSAKRRRLDDRGYIRGYVESFARVEHKLLKEWEEGLPEYEPEDKPQPWRCSDS